MENQVNVDGFNEIYMDIAEYLGEEVALKIYERYKGQQIVFPMKLYKREYIAKMIEDEYDGTNLKELARKYNYTERWLRKKLLTGSK